MKVTVYGSSDDLIEIEGGIHEEFSIPGWSDDCGAHFLAFSDGTLLGAKYDDDGVWRFPLLAKGSATMTKTEGVPDDDANYTDRVTLEGDLRWVVLGKQKAVATTQAKAELLRELRARRGAPPNTYKQRP